jgi:hypothetical protein
MQTTNIIDNNENKTRSRKTKTLQLNFYHSLTIQAIPDIE